MKKLFILAFASIALASCNKKDVEELNFNLSTDKVSYKVGDTVNFKLSGNPDQVVFFSGEIGHKYIYKDRTEAESNKITLEFATNRRYGADAQQPQSLRLFATQNFDGKYLEASIKENEWVDITAAFTLSAIMGNDNYTSSGEVNLLDLEAQGLNVDKSKPIYFAFRYKGYTGSTQARWWINKFDINTIATDGQILKVADIGAAGWTPVSFAGSSAVTWVFATDKILKYQGGNATLGSNTVWAVSNALNLTKVLPDTGVPLKNMSTRLDAYTYIYNTPGTYTATIVASNVNVYGESKVIKEVTIEVLPN